MTAVAGGVDVEATYRRHLSAGRARLNAVLGGQVEVAAHGCVVVDAKGEAYLSCGGYGAFLLGHGHPRVVAAVQEQAAQRALATRLFLDPVQALAAQALVRVAPRGLDRVYFATSGADAVEAAIKLARLHGKRRLIGTRDGFHGKTLGALSVSGNAALRDPFAPLLADVLHVPFDDVDALERALADADPACVLLEPIQSEGGVRLPSPGYLAAVAAACREHGALLVLDEIATGLGRVGAWWACEQEGVVPDMLLAGKALGGGVVPVGAVLASDEAFAPFDRDPFIHSATFAGAPLVMAGVEATLEALTDEDVAPRAAALGSRLLAGLRASLVAAIAEGLVLDVRGRGLLIGVELASPALAGDFEYELIARRVIPNHCLNHHSVVRFTPPVGLSEDEIGWLLDAVADSAAALVARRCARARTRARRRAA
ncbi:MAG TPA: aminotransferase class III-fold pyridoxal phosphate-dependent enzyme [Conexibacter sp.]|nr:aminotransferase class III-fold pyridoxal phosphate-dependent enzyme [Conexibacter sp.]